VQCYNEEHHRSGIQFVTPDERHRGQDPAILAKRKELYQAAKERNPQRWSGHVRNWEPVGNVWLNPENSENADAEIREKAA